MDEVNKIVAELVEYPEEAACHWALDDEYEEFDKSVREDDDEIEEVPDEDGGGKGSLKISEDHKIQWYNYKSWYNSS